MADELDDDKVGCAWERMGIVVALADAVDDADVVVDGVLLFEWTCDDRRTSEGKLAELEFLKAIDVDDDGLTSDSIERTETVTLVFAIRDGYCAFVSTSNGRNENTCFRFEQYLDRPIIIPCIVIIRMEAYKNDI